MRVSSLLASCARRIPPGCPRNLQSELLFSCCGQGNRADTENLPDGAISFTRSTIPPPRTTPPRTKAARPSLTSNSSSITTTTSPPSSSFYTLTAAHTRRHGTSIQSIITTSTPFAPYNTTSSNRQVSSTSAANCLPAALMKCNPSAIPPSPATRVKSTMPRPGRKFSAIPRSRRRSLPRVARSLPYRENRFFSARAPIISACITGC